ncbi:MAG: hypothetical protein AAGA93_12200 [Actinomycetota bacterium]
MELFGRDTERTQVVERLAQRRLVTICGPGGIGKTALARSVADGIGDEYPLGAAAIDLTRVDDAAAVTEAIAGQLGYADFDSLRDSPSEEAILLVVDNCEHVLDAAADALTQLLEASPTPRVIATSRTPLDVIGESIVSLAPLSTPPPGDVDTASPSVRLLSARARDHGVDLGPDDEEAAAEVCRRLDGIPLAIEIAAARLRTMGLRELAAQLDQPGVLSRRRFRGRASHGSVAELVDWSYRLLDPDRQRTFEELAVFAGPFTGELARSVAGGGGAGAGGGGDSAADAGVAGGDGQELLDELVAASLVVVDRSSDLTRYRLLHPVRAVAAQLLERSGRAGEVRSRLVDVIIAETLAISRGGPDGWRPSDLHGLLDLYDHTAASIRWLLDHDDGPDRALLLVAVLWGIVHNAHSTEIHQLGESVLARWPDPTSRRWPAAAATVATCRFLSGDTGGAIELAERALPNARGRRAAPALLLRVMAQSRRAQGDLEGARAGFAEAAGVAAEREAHGLAMEMLVDEALAIVELGDAERGLAQIESVIVEADRRNALINRQWAEASRAATLVRRDPHSPEAAEAIESALSSARRLGYPAGTSFCLRLRGEAELAADRLDDTAATVLELLDELSRRAGLDELRYVLDLAAEVMRRRDDDGWADLVATAADLPITSFLTPLEMAVPAELVEPGRSLSIREVYVRCRSAMLVELERSGRSGPGGVAAPAPVDAETDPPGAGPAEPAAGRVAETTAELVAEGDVWRLTMGSSTIRIKSSKGLVDLAALLDVPGREIPAVDLTGGVSTVADDEVIDAEARRRYEDRVRELQADIDEAEAGNDLAMAERHRVELDALVDELTAAIGLGGRHRRLGSESERARSAVTQRLRTTIRRIADLDDDLGAHFRNSISTGTYCAYRPHPPVRWRVER